MDEQLIRLFEKAETLSDIFEVVKATVEKTTGKSRGGIMLGLANLGNQPNGFFGAFYPVGSNIIVMNNVPLQRIKETCLLYTSPSPRDYGESRMPSSA